MASKRGRLRLCALWNGWTSTFLLAASSYHLLLFHLICWLDLRYLLLTQQACTWSGKDAAASAAVLPHHVECNHGRALYGYVGPMGHLVSSDLFELLLPVASCGWSTAYDCTTAAAACALEMLHIYLVGRAHTIVGNVVRSFSFFPAYLICIPTSCRAVLFFMAIWDLIAVLCPFGPLRLLVEMTEEKGVAIPDALIYTTMLEPEDDAATTTPKKTLLQITGLGIDAGTAQPRPARRPVVATTEAVERAVPAVSAEAESKERSGPKLGLGDFIFYSILMATVRS